MPRLKRQALNHTVARDVNERVEVLAERWGKLGDGRYEFFCECSKTGCRTTVRATVPEYDRVRSHPSMFFVARGHEDEDREEVVYRTEKFVVVRVAEGEPASVGFS